MKLRCAASNTLREGIFLVSGLFVQIFSQKRHRLLWAMVYAPVTHCAFCGSDRLAVLNLDILCRTVLRADTASDTLGRIDLNLIGIACRFIVEPESLT